VNSNQSNIRHSQFKALKEGLPIAGALEEESEEAKLESEKEADPV